jgi:hypothetical protein
MLIIKLVKACHATIEVVRFVTEVLAGRAAATGSATGTRRP